MKIGRIPERVVAYLQQEKTGVGDGTSSSWWSFPPDRRETPGFSMYKARPAFVVPADSEAFKESAAKWASGTQYGGKARAFDTHGFDNEPFTNLRWVGLDSRSEGGVVYKVVTEQGWLVDLRDDVVMECLFEGAIHQLKTPPQGPGTYFTAQFVWVVMGSQSRIVRVGSKTHQEIVESEVRKELADIKPEDLEVGGVYQNRQGKEAVLIAKGKGRRVLVQDLHRYSWCKSKATDQQMVDGAIEALDKPNVYPGWHWVGNWKVVNKIGKLKVPEGLGERYDQKVGATQRTAAEWNRSLSR